MRAITKLIIATQRETGKERENMFVWEVMSICVQVWMGIYMLGDI